MKADLLDRLLAYSKENGLFNPEDQIIIAVSGGGDSVALVDLFSRLNQPVTLAHCNFNLRGQESDRDEDFVRKISVVYDLPLLVTAFQTTEYAVERGISVEMAARELRYSWFENIRRETGSKFVAVAHHADDSVETMLINMIRGTGTRGLCGIQPRHGNIIRPLLFSNRKEITDYLKYRNLEFRTDSSNKDTRYIRNRIRQVILPEMEKINPSVREILLEEQKLFLQAQQIIDQFTNLKAKELVTTEIDQMKIDINRLKSEEFPETILFEILRPYGFHGRQIPRILSSSGSASGKEFKSKTHTLLIDRQEIIISEGFDQSTERYYLDPEFPCNDLPIRLECRTVNESNYQPARTPNMACLDFEKLDLPLILRKWETGDFFYPLGMDQAKKLSDFFIDQKVNRLDKNRTWILASGEKIVWVIGYRIDNRFRITDETREILEITFTS
jgi:tRNA(Ile)-lysidine synthase